MAYSDRYLLFIEYFNKSKFMSAQTTLDEMWLEESGKDKQFYGGLIQVAVSLYHLTNGNPKGAQKIYEKARKMLVSYDKTHLGIELGKLIQECDLLYSKHIQPENTDSDYLKLVPKIEFQG